MIKKLILTLSLISIILVSCNDYFKSEIVSYYTDSIPKLEYFYKYHGNKEYLAKEIRYFPNGNILSESFFDENNKRTGTWINYHENGKKWTEENYSENNKEGAVTEWYKSGKKMYKGYYSKNLPHGKWTFWDENGKKISTNYYEYGEIKE